MTRIDFMNDHEKIKSLWDAIWVLFILIIFITLNLGFALHRAEKRIKEIETQIRK